MKSRIVETVLHFIDTHVRGCWGGAPGGFRPRRNGGGGARDAEDESITYTAIRETHEEVGIAPEHVEVLGRLNDHKTRTGFHITPFVGYVTPGKEYDHNQIEVNVVLEVPFTDLWETYLKGRQPLKYGENTIMAYEFHHDGYRIWGATAGILAEFFDVLMATSTE